MPVVVNKGFEGPGGFYFDALRGLAVGLSEKAVAQEDTRRYEQDYGLKRDTLEEQVRQSTLDRDQQLFLNKMLDDRERTLARNELEAAMARQLQEEAFQQYMTSSVVQPFQAQQNEADRVVQKRGQSLNYSQAMDSNLKGWQSNQSALELERQRYVTNAGAELEYAESVLGGRTYGDMTPDEQATALDSMTNFYVGQGRTTNAPGVLQATPEEVNAARNRAVDSLVNFKGKRDQYFLRVQETYKRENAYTAAVATTANNLGDFPALAPMPGTPISPDIREKMSSWDLDRMEGWAKVGPLASARPRLLYDLGKDKEEDDEILKMIAGYHIMAASGAYDFRSRENQMYELKAQIRTKMETMDRRSKQIEAYYMDIAERTLLPENFPDAVQAPTPQGTDPSLLGPAG